MLTDIDECAEELHTCKLGMPGGMACVNEPGSFRCECFPGFAKDGTICKGQYLVSITLTERHHHILTCFCVLFRR